MPDFSDDMPVLWALDQPNAELIGFGGEARVYAYGADEVMRISHPSTSWEDVQAGFALAEAIFGDSAHLNFQTPQVSELRRVKGRIVRFEKRLPGQTLSALLKTVVGDERTALIRSLFDAAAQLSSIQIDRDFYGDLVGAEPVRTADYAEFLVSKISKSLREAPQEFAGIDAHQIARAVSDIAGPAVLVHLDLFSGNILFKDNKVSAIIDFGPTAMMGDQRMELWSAAAYLDAEISPDATDVDRATAMACLNSRGLLAGYDAAKQWIAAYWTFAHDDPKVLAWCRSVLLSGA